MPVRPVFFAGFDAQHRVFAEGDGLIGEEAYVASAGEVTDLFGGAVGNDFSVVHEHDALREVLRLFQVVGGENNGFAGFGEFVHAFPEGAAGGNVHAGGGLIQDEDIRVVHGGDSEPDTLLLPAGAFADFAVCQLGQVCIGEHLVHVEAGGVQRGEHVEGLLHGEVFEQPAGLQHRPNVSGLYCGFGGGAVNGEDTAVGGAQPQEHVDEGGFTRPVGT